MIHPIPALTRTGAAALLMALTVTASLAQTADLPAGSVTALEEVQFPRLDDFQTDQQVIDGLSAQGYDRIAVVRGPDTIAVAAERRQVPTQLLFSTVDGRLLMVDGIEPVLP